MGQYQPAAQARAQRIPLLALRAGPGRSTRVERDLGAGRRGTQFRLLSRFTLRAGNRYADLRVYSFFFARLNVRRRVACPAADSNFFGRSPAAARHTVRVSPSTL
jgi:hypothetical protein